MAYTDKEKIWSLRYLSDVGAEEAVLCLSRELNISQVCARLLYNRGYVEKEQAQRFLNTDVSSLHDPYLLCDMSPAVHRIAQAIDQGEKITVYGDYDVDGVTSVTLAYLYFKSQGADIDYYIPSRITNDFGIDKPPR